MTEDADRSVESIRKRFTATEHLYPTVAKIARLFYSDGNVRFETPAQDTYLVVCVYACFFIFKSHHVQYSIRAFSVRRASFWRNASSQ